MIKLRGRLPGLEIFLFENSKIRVAVKERESCPYLFYIFGERAILKKFEKYFTKAEGDITHLHVSDFSL